MRHPGLLIALLLVPCLAGPGAQAADAAPVPGQRAVLVTGSSSGIGRAITLRLAADGCFVYAGVRKDADMTSLAALHNVQPLRLDVTDAQQIAAAVQTITQAGRGLYALVNNAGIGSFAPVVAPHKDELDLTLAVNAVAPYRLVQAFAPLILVQKGRIVTIGSIGGVVAGSGAGAYAMSKFAVEGLTDALAAELGPQGVQVSVAEPGTYVSNISRNAVARGQAPDGIPKSQEGDPDQVARAVEHALFDAAPKRRYLVVPSAPQAEFTIRAAMQRLVQLNEGQPYTLDRDALVKLLDEALVHSQPRTQQ